MIQDIIFCIPFVGLAQSNGIVSIMRMANHLESMGVNVYFMNIFSEYPEREIIFTDSFEEELGKDLWNHYFQTINEVANFLNIKFITEPSQLIESGALVVYGERIINNPLNSRKTIRYFGHRNGLLNGGQLVNTMPDDFILSHSRILHPQANHYLFFAEINDLFKQEVSHSFKGRDKSVTYTGKGSLYGEVKLINGSELITRDHPPSKTELSDLLRRSRFFFTWDCWTNLIAEAIFCGAIPVIMRYEPFTKVDLDQSELGPIPTMEVSQIRWHERQKNFVLKNPSDEEKFRKSAQIFMQKQQSYELSYGQSVKEMLEKLNAHFV
jgi:hypothetical protein